MNLCACGRSLLIGKADGAQKRRTCGGSEMSYGGRPTELITRSLILFVSIYLIPFLLYKFSKMKYEIKQKFYQALFFIILAFVAFLFITELVVFGI